MMIDNPHGNTFYYNITLNIRRNGYWNNRSSSMYVATTRRTNSNWRTSWSRNLREDRNRKWGLPDTGNRAFDIYILQLFHNVCVYSHYITAIPLICSKIRSFLAFQSISMRNSDLLSLIIFMYICAYTYWQVVKTIPCELLWSFYYPIMDLWILFDFRNKQIYFIIIIRVCNFVRSLKFLFVCMYVHEPNLASYSVHKKIDKRTTYFVNAQTIIRYRFKHSQCSTCVFTILALVWNIFKISYKSKNNNIELIV